MARKSKAFDHSKYQNWIDPAKTVPYERNAKIHTEKQIKNLVNSINRFGWQQDVVITSDNVLVIGHGRRLAALQIGCEMPYHVIDKKADELTDDDIRELRIADNQINAETGNDWEMLEAELEDMTLEGFDFDFGSPDDWPDDEDEDENDGRKRKPAENFTDPDEDPLPRLQHNTFDNFDRDFVPEYTGKYGIPVMDATRTTGTEFMRFCDWKENDDPGDIIAHFYYDDYKFIQAWKDPDLYVERLRKFKAVISPDFSLYTDFPLALQIMSCYRRQWVGAYWQSIGLDVIPDVVWGEPETFEFCFDGIPKRGTVAVSSVGVKNDKDWNGKEGDLFKRGYDEMLKRLEPKTVLFYGHMIDGLGGNIIRIPSFYETRREVLPNGKRK